MTDNQTAQQTAVTLADAIARRIELMRNEGEELRSSAFADLLPDESVTRLIALDSAAATLVGALTWLRKTIGVRVGDELDGRSLEIGDELVSYRPTRQRRLINRPGFIEWLGDDYARVVSMPLAGGRKGELARICSERGVDYGTIEDTFFEEILGEPKLTYTPLEIVESAVRT